MKPETDEPVSLPRYLRPKESDTSEIEALAHAVIAIAVADYRSPGSSAHSTAEAFLYPNYQADPPWGRPSNADPAAPGMTLSTVAWIGDLDQTWLRLWLNAQRPKWDQQRSDAISLRMLRDAASTSPKKKRRSRRRAAA